MIPHQILPKYLHGQVWARRVTQVPSPVTLHVALVHSRTITSVHHPSEDEIEEGHDLSNILGESEARSDDIDTIPIRSLDDFVFYDSKTLRLAKVPYDVDTARRHFFGCGVARAVLSAEEQASESEEDEGVLVRISTIKEVWCDEE